MIKKFMITLKNKSLLQLGTHDVMRFMYFSTNYISPYTLRGIIGSLYFREKCLLANQEACLIDKCPQKDKCEFYNSFLHGEGLYLTPAYPSLNECSDVSVPATYLFSRCKVCGFTTSKLSLYLSVTRGESRRTLVHHKNKEGKVCGLSTLAPLKNQFFCLTNGKLIPAPKRQQKVSVAIDRKSGTSKEGSLFLYDGIRPGFVFKSQVTVADGNLATFIAHQNKSEVFIGRGKSRGFGLTELEITPINIDLKKRASEIKKYSVDENNYLIGITLSPVFDFVLGDGIIATTGHIDLAKAANSAAKIVGLNVEFDNTIESEQIFGENIRVGGWSLLALQPKTRFYAVNAGAVYIFKLDRELADNSALTLAALEQVGYAPIKMSGFGIFRFVNSSLFENFSLNE